MSIQKAYNSKTIKPKVCWIDKKSLLIVYNQQFDKEKWLCCKSQLEAETYACLRQVFPVKQIIKDYPLLIKPPTSNYKQLVWKCDFAISAFAGDEILYFIECKGIKTTEFSLQLQLLEYFSYDDWRKLLIVSKSASLNIPNRPVLNLAQLLPHIGKGSHNESK